MEYVERANKAKLEAIRNETEPPLVELPTRPDLVIETENGPVRVGVEAMAATQSDPSAFMVGVGELVAVPPEILGFDPGIDDGHRAALVVTAVDHDSKTITIEAQP